MEARILWCAGASVLRGVCNARVCFSGTVLSRVGSCSLVWRWPVLDCILVTSYCGPSGGLALYKVS
jgi:hypothetical protein